MKLPNPVKWLRERRRRNKLRDIKPKLTKAFLAAQAAPPLTLPAGKRMIILSDQHKGAGDGADDFLRCERSYNAALAYYHRLGYHLVLLGDVEELWENKLEDVTATYRHTLKLEARFNDEPGRYTRIYGNHDLLWKRPGEFGAKMGEAVRDVEPLEAVLLTVEDAPGGQLFLVHGHQGTPDSDRNARVSQWLVRHGWRRLQVILNRPWNTPAVDWSLRGNHAKEIYAWAFEEKQVTVTGHTHLPVFYESKDVAEEPPAPDADDPSKNEALREARREWAAAERRRLERQQPPELKTPCYFNTGCCSFGDGDITGIEIADGMIRLIRWECKPEAEPKQLGTAELDLDFVFNTVDEGAGVRQA